MWLAPHQVPAARRLRAILARHGGALLADAVGLGKSYVALAVALAEHDRFTFVVPAVLVPQWRRLLARFDVDAPIITHESLSLSAGRPTGGPSGGLFVVDEAHRFRNPATNRYRALARLVVGGGVLLVTATPVHNRIGDLFHLFRLFLRDHALAALGVPSLRRAAMAEIDPALAAAAATRLIVARSRDRVRAGYARGPVALAFPHHGASESVRAGPVPERLLDDLVRGVSRLQTGGPAAPLLRLMLLRRLASSLPAFRASLLRYEAYLDLAIQAHEEGRGLSARAFQRLFPRAAEPDLQLALFPLLLETSTTDAPADRREIARLQALAAAAPAEDPKAAALERLLDARPAKTIVFTDAVATVRYLLRRLRSRRVAAVFGTAGRFAAGDGSPQDVLRAFAPRAQNAVPPPAALRTDLLIATDLVSEGLNLQDAERVVHYDLPWSPARLAQRVGRIDRLGSAHRTIATATFLPPEPLAEAMAIEQRLAAKIGAQRTAGSAGTLDWTDRLQSLADPWAPRPPADGTYAAVVGRHMAAVLVVRIGGLVEAIVVEGEAARADPDAATHLLTQAAMSRPVPLAMAALHGAIRRAAPLIRSRLGAVQSARWRAPDRDRLARRLIPWVLSAARRAAHRGDAAQLGKLDALVSRLALGMTAGEELLLDEMLARRDPLTVKDLIAWHERLPAVTSDDTAPGVELVAGLVIDSVDSPTCPSPPSSSTSTERSSIPSS